ncbi:MAG TPA: methyltransferase domain-containing protein [Pirellulales bacterium]|nr:methyltransferase domain-containing protein [Pirellulales bacterium]
MIPRQLEPEVMDSEAEATDYDAIDHREVNRKFVDDLLAFERPTGRILDLGCGTALIPIELCRRAPAARVVGVDFGEAMIALGRKNVATASLEQAIRLELADAKHLPFADGHFDAVISNSIVHHIPEPREVLDEALRVLAKDAAVFVRDLMRPPDERTLDELVATYAGDSTPPQRRMFAESLHAALTLDEMRELVKELGFAAQSVQATSDRHWTWAVRRGGQENASRPVRG